MSWNVHISFKSDPPRSVSGFYATACNLMVDGVEPRYSEEMSHLRICPDCADAAKPDGRGYWTVLVPAKKNQDME